MITDIGTHTALKGQHYPEHSHEIWELIYYRSGSIETVIEREVCTTTPGTVLVIAPHQKHFERALSDYSLYYLSISAKMFPSLALKYQDDKNARLLRLFATMHYEWKAEHANKALMLELLLKELIILLQRQQDAPPLSAAEQLVIEAETLMAEDISNAPNMSELAEILGVSSSTLRAHFAKLRPYTAKGYLLQLRLERVTELLENSTLTLEKIGALCGYDSASHLTHHVKKATGKTPGALRKC